MSDRFEEFNSILRALYNIDRAEFEKAIGGNPPHWFVAAPSLKAEAIWRLARSRTRHYHVASQQGGDLKDICALCGHDLRHSIHLRVGEER